MQEAILFRPAAPGEEAQICALVERVFNQFVAPDYPEEGVQEFYGFANPQAMQKRAVPGQIVLVAERAGQLCGMIEMRQFEHIALLFVEQQGQGIARALLDLAIQECRKQHPALSRITVNSSPFAEKVYRHLGFLPSSPAQTLHGITFIPMLRALG